MIANTLLPEFDQEMATTRRLLERVPDAEAAWKPHPKSTNLGDLAQHIATLAGFGAMIINQPELDAAAGGGLKPPRFVSAKALLETFDENVRKSRAAIAGVADADLGAKWTFRNGDHVIFSLPRAAVLRTLLVNHMIHHRGQLSVYLRLRDVPLPSIYGPTADEPM
ncbi:MAG TPA: DinB family protein [Gemmatimonadaceae bacterium]|nr:DinB family protein [Gemmatimonadaceae bacterium]